MSLHSLKLFPKMPRPRRTRKIKTDRSESTDIGPKTRNLVKCQCILHCNGSKLVDPRTFRKHQQEAERFRTIASGSQSTSSTISRPVDEVGSTSSEQEAEESQDSSNGYNSSSDKSDQAADLEQIDIPTKRKRYHKFYDQIEPVPDIPDDSDDDNRTEVSTSGNDSTADEDHRLSDDEVPVEQFTAPDWDDLDFDSDNEDPDTNLDSSVSWILLWILKYQARFRLPEVAIDSLIKFFWIVLLDADYERFKNFPMNSHKMRKLLEINKESKKYVVCPSCNKLYDFNRLKEPSTSELKCDHVEFPNHLKKAKGNLAEQK